jgi:hypothetical protein
VQLTDDHDTAAGLRIEDGRLNGREEEFVRLASNVERLDGKQSLPVKGLSAFQQLSCSG